MRGPASLRRQLLLLGMMAVVLPLLVLLAVVSFTFTNEEVMLDESGAPLAVAEESADVPTPIIVAAGLLAIAGCGAVWFWSGRAVRPMATITSVANEIQAGSLDRRIGMTSGALEVKALADSFDDMLQRLARSSTTQQQLIEDASHELRTPLAALAVNNEVILSKGDATLQDFRESAKRSEALIGRLQLTIDDLLVGARDRTRRTRQIDNDLMTIVARAVDQHRAVNPAVPVIVSGPSELHLGIDGPSVQRALINLLENAARYSPNGVPIEIDVVDGEPATLTVTDHGPGIPEDQRQSIFDRYYQGDAGGGAGIGLALVKQVAEAHGRIDVTSPISAGVPGTRFTITFSARQA